MLSNYPIPGVGQVPEELDRLHTVYRGACPRRVLEIGVANGGTLKGWLTLGTPEIVVAVDLDHSAREEYENWVSPDTVLIVLSGSSQSERVIRQVRLFAPYDWVFIDGDHDEESVRLDAGLAFKVTQPGGRILFHDIVTDEEKYGATGPRLAFEALRNRGYANWKIVEDPRPSGYPEDSAHGIGIVRK